MTDVIPKVGEYVTARRGGGGSSFKVEIKTIFGEWAIGYTGLPAGEPTIWDKETGKYRYGRDLPDITGPYVPARKRVEGWVNMMYGSFSEVRLFNHTVPVREIDPAAEKEARELRDKWDRPTLSTIDDGQTGECIDDLRRALSLLLRDEAPCK